MRNALKRSCTGSRVRWRSEERRRRRSARRRGGVERAHSDRVERGLLLAVASRCSRRARRVDEAQALARAPAAARARGEARRRRRTCRGSFVAHLRQRLLLGAARLGPVARSRARAPPSRGGTVAVGKPTCAESESARTAFWSLDEPRELAAAPARARACSRLDSRMRHEEAAVREQRGRDQVAALRRSSPRSRRRSKARRARASARRGQTRGVIVVGGDRPTGGARPRPRRRAA